MRDKESRYFKCDLLIKFDDFTFIEADDERDKATTLLNYMFSGYDRRIRPFANRNKPVIVEMTIVLAILTELVSYY